MSSSADYDAEDASLVTAQEAFSSSGSRLAAKVIRTTDKSKKPPSSSTDANEYVRHRPEGYEQNKGVRFRLDNLEDEDAVPERADETRSTNGQPTNAIPVGSAMVRDIIERTTSSTSPPVFTATRQRGPKKGFPAPRRLVQTQLTTRLETSAAIGSSPSGPLQHEGKALMDEIDRENKKKLAEMSQEEILQLQKTLQESLPASLREKLLNKPKSKIVESTEEGGSPIPSQAKPSKKLPDDTLDDPSFDTHLRMFFPPTTTTSIPQPEWTLPIHPAEETFYSITDNSSPEPSTMRFDFNGKYIPSDTSRSLPTLLGLHHHSLDPGAAGYMLSELSILARSIQPSQKCIALKIIGFVLSDIAKGTYAWDVTEGLWDEIDSERIIEILLEIAKGGRESGGNRSVQRYAEDAVSRWVEVRGRKIWEERLQKRGFEKVDNDKE